MIYFRFHMCCTCHMLVSIVKFRTAHVAGRRSLQSLSQLSDPSKTWIADRRLRPSQDSLHPELGRCLMERNVSKATVQVIQLRSQIGFRPDFPAKKFAFATNWIMLPLALGNSALWESTLAKRSFRHFVISTAKHWETCLKLPGLRMKICWIGCWLKLGVNSATRSC